MAACGNWRGRDIPCTLMSVHIDLCGRANDTTRPQCMSPCRHPSRHWRHWELCSAFPQLLKQRGTSLCWWGAREAWGDGAMLERENDRHQAV